MADRPHDTILKLAFHDGSNDRCCSKIPDHLSQLRVVKDRGAQPPQMGVREVARMSNTSLTGVKACVFDAYGTLFDFASAAKRCRDLWAQEPYVVLINPRDKAPAVGWDAVKKDWQDRVLGFWSELKLTPKQAPQIHINQGVASTTGMVGVEGKNKSGQALSFTIVETQVYEKRGDRWLMVSHHASQVPE